MNTRLQIRSLLNGRLQAKVATLTADNTLHHLRIEAPGFISRNQTIKLEQDSTLELSLVAESPRALEALAAPLAYKPSGTGRLEVPAKGKRSLDSRNPYER